MRLEMTQNLMSFLNQLFQESLVPRYNSVRDELKSISMLDYFIAFPYDVIGCYTRGAC